MPTFEVQERGVDGPGLTPLERAVVTYLRLDVEVVCRRSEQDFDVDVYYRDEGSHLTVAWLVLLMLYREWCARPALIGELIEAAGGPAASKCASDWDYVRDLDDTDKFVAICHALWAVIDARSAG